jgi:soluble lytic murein transglycosylase
MAWVYHQQGDLRRAITSCGAPIRSSWRPAAKAAAEILQVIFPLTYWDAIKRTPPSRSRSVRRRRADRAGVDVRSVGASSANAWGLMQIVPSTGRRLAASLGIRRFSTSMLTNGDTNIRLGTLYFKRLVQQFGGTYYALASYNAGENRVVRWKAERPGMEEDEFIDDIPFPETQNYVKRILGDGGGLSQSLWRRPGSAAPHDQGSRVEEARPGREEESTGQEEGACEARAGQEEDAPVVRRL